MAHKDICDLNASTSQFGNLKGESLARIKHLRKIAYVNLMASYEEIRRLCELEETTKKLENDYSTLTTCESFMDFENMWNPDEILKL